MVKHTHKILTVLGLCVVLSACSDGAAGIRDELGLKREAPDEFRVVKRAPLEMPTDFSLPVPRPGEARPQEPAPRDRAKAIITGVPLDETQSKTDGEKAFLSQAGADNADSAIRHLVDKETKEMVEDRVSVIEKLGIREPKAVKGTPIDPFAEADKLEQDGVVNRVVRPAPLNAPNGDAVPVDVPENKEAGKDDTKKDVTQEDEQNEEDTE